MAENEKLEQVAKTSSNKAEKAKKDKPGIFERAAKWLREMRSELKKVQWPTRKQTINNTGVVIACTGVVGFFIWVFDFIASGAIQGLISLLG